MRRDLERLEKEPFDLLVIGGGIMGLAAAREAAHRGLSTALVEKGDFGAATSANSLKLIHGGLRYLQHGDIGRLRQSVRERLAFMRTAPHLVHPLPFLVPTYGHTTKSKEAYSIAFLLYRLLAWDRNRTGDPDKEIPPGKVVSAGEVRRLFGGFRDQGLTGGAIFHDGQMFNSERLTLSVGLAAAARGAVLANHARVVGFLEEQGRVAGAVVRDEITGEERQVRARMVLNAAGPWADSLLGLLSRRVTGSGYLLAKAVNIVTPKQLSPDYAVGIESREEASDALVKRGGRLYFVTPWRGISIVGTTYHTYREDPDALRVTEGDVMELVNDINGAWPGAALGRKDVTFFHAGLVPISAETGPGGANLAKADRIIDHARDDGLEGLVSLVGVKYTTARDVAGQAVDLVLTRLGRQAPPSGTEAIALPGGDMGPFGEFLANLLRRGPGGLPAGVLEHLACTYGSDLETVLGYGQEDPGWLEPVAGSDTVLRAEVLHGVRREMALSLADTVLRRTELGATGHPGEECLRECAGIMAGELGWDGERIEAEMSRAAACFATAG